MCRIERLRPVALRLVLLGAVLGGLSLLWVVTGPIYARVLASLVSGLMSTGLDVRTQDDSVYVIATQFSPETRQTNIHFHSFLLSYGYLVALGLFLIDFGARIKPRLDLLGISGLALLVAHVVGLYVAGSVTESWLKGDKTPDDIYGAVTTLSLAWALVPAGVWTMSIFYRNLSVPHVSPGESASARSKAQRSGTSRHPS